MKTVYFKFNLYTVVLCLYIIFIYSNNNVISNYIKEFETNNIKISNYNFNSSKISFNSKFNNNNKMFSLFNKEMLSTKFSKICEKLNCKNKVTYKVKAVEYNSFNSKANVNTLDEINLESKKEEEKKNNIYVKNNNNNSLNIKKKKKYIIHNQFKNNNNMYYNRYISFNSCKEENCEFCCLGTNKCGSEKQCYNSKTYTFIFRIFFIVITLYFFIILCIKWRQAEGYPEHIKVDRIKKEIINDLVYNQNIVLNSKNFLDE